MTYTLKTDDPTFGHGLRRIAADQLDRAIASLEEPGSDVHEAVHDARKRCKKLRGLIRLVRGSFPDYKAENMALRDAARTISDLRDKTAMIETYDRLMLRYGELLHRPAFAPLRSAFTRDRNAAAEAGDLSDRMAVMAGALRTIRGRVETWELKGDGVTTLEDGLKLSYGRARDAMEVAKSSRNPEALHDWRKRVKYHWYHMRLLSDAQSEPLAAREATADRLSDILGDHHDLLELRARLEAAPLGADATRLLDGLAAKEMERLETEAFVLGKSLLSRKPKKIARDVTDAVGTWYRAA